MGTAAVQLGSDGCPNIRRDLPFSWQRSFDPYRCISDANQKEFSRTHQRMIGRTPSPSPIRHAVDSCTYNIYSLCIIYTPTTCMCVGVCREGEKVMGEGKRNFTLKGYGTLLTTSTSSGCLIDRSGSHACLTSFSISISFFLSLLQCRAAGRPARTCMQQKV